MDPLHLINQEDFPKLKRLLGEEFPKSFVVDCWIDTRLKWQKIEPNENAFFICCPEGNVKDGLVTFGVVGDKVYYLTLFTFHDDCKTLEAALLNTKRIPWSDKMVCGIPQGLEKWFTNNILNALGYEIHHDTPTDFYRLPKEVPPSFEIKCPEDVSVALLKQEDIPKINSLWKHSFQGSDRLISKCISLNYGFGVYSKKDGQLLSWIVKYEYSDVGILQTDENNRKKGYGKLVIQAICKRIAEDGEDVLTFIVPGNTASESIFKGLGFKRGGSYNWLEYDDKIKRLNKIL